MLEPVILCGIIVAFWHHSPPIRDSWVGLLWLAVPIFRLRMLGHKRLWAYTLLIDSFLLFILLSAYNFHHAPFARAHYPVLICRPLAGMWLYVYLSDHSREYGMKLLIAASIAISFIVGFLALTATQWWIIEDKNLALTGILDVMPRISYRDFLPDMSLSFNPNEIAGAIAWCCPLMAGLIFYRVNEKEARWQAMSIKIAAGISFLVLFIALIPGQSRFAIAGILLALFFIIWFLAKSPTLKRDLLAVWAAIVVFQVIIFFNLLPLPTSPVPADTATDSAATETDSNATLSSRDERSIESRLDTWASGLRMMLDYPLTGTGMSMFRTAARDTAYLIPFYEEQTSSPPHAHNEWIQIGADLGLPGLALFAFWYAGAAWMLWQGWQAGDENHRVLVISIAGGLLAHAVYGLGDAVTLWDRYSFMFWLMLGLAAAQYTALRNTHTQNTEAALE